METPLLKILLVEDNPGDARLVREMISEATIASFELEWMNRLQDGLDRAQQDRFDVILLDLELPDSIGMQTVTRMRDAAPGVPIIVMTSLDDEKLAAVAVQNGAQDYMIKGRQDPDLFSRSVFYAVERSRSQKAIRESELRYRTIFEQSPDSIILIDAETGFPIEFNDVACRQFGYSREEMSHLRLADLEVTDDPEQTARAVEKMEREGAVTFESHHRRKDGAVRDVRISLQKVELGSRPMVYCIVSDITESKQAERALRDAIDQSRQRWRETDGLLAAAREVMTEQDFTRAARAIFTACKELIGATSGYVALKNNQGNENDVLFLDPGGLSCIVDPSLPMPIRGLRALAYQQGEAVYENNFATSDYISMMPEGHVELQNVLFAPLMRRGDAVGLLGVANKPGGFNENDLRLATAFSELMSVSLAKTEAFTSLEKSEERFRSITASATDAIISADESGNIVTWNKSAEAMFGYTAEEALGQQVTLLMPETFRDPHISGMQSFLTTGNARVMGRAVELTGLRKDGTEFPVELSLSSWKTAEGTFFGSVIRDVTEKTRIRRFNEALNSIMMTISSTPEIDQIMKDIMEDAASALKADSTVLASISDGRYVVKYVQGSPIDVRSGEAAASGNAPVAASVIATGKAMAVSDMFVDSQFDPKELQRLGIRSAIGAPLIMRDKLTGAIDFRFAEKREFTPADIDFVEKLASAISLGMENAELFRTEKETRADIQGYAVQLSILHEIGISLNRETSIPRLRDIIVRSATSLTSSGVSFMTMSVDGGPALGPVSHAPWMASEEPVIDDDVTLLHDHLVKMAGDKDRYAFRVTDPERLPWFPQKYAGLGDLLVGVIRDTRGRIRALFVMGAKFEGGSFGRSDEDIISLLAAQSSVAMTSAESFEKEHDIAETLQTALLPDIPVRRDMEIGLLYRSASSAGRIGGDFYDFGELDTNVVSVAVGDVCGKGLSAASHTAMVKFMLRAYLEEGRSPGECLTLLNESLCKNLEPDKFITLALAVIDVAAGKIRYSLAGHPLPIISRDGEVVELEVPRTIPLGVVPGYSFSTVETFFNPSTSMVMYTDGLLEARSRDEEQFGTERLAAEFSSADGLSAQHLAQNIVDKVLEFSGDELQDDVALVVVRALQQYDN